MWEYINTTTYGGVSPPPRELHSVAVVNGDLFLFGGKSRIYPSPSDYVFGDLWRLNVEPKNSNFDVEWKSVEAISELEILQVSVNGSANGGIQRNGGGVDARSGMCVASMQVQVRDEIVSLNMLKSLCANGSGEDTTSVLSSDAGVTGRTWPEYW